MTLRSSHADSEAGCYAARLSLSTVRLSYSGGCPFTLRGIISHLQLIANEYSLVFFFQK